MEKKKLLLVAISVGLFLVIAIGAALVVFAPKTAPSAIASNRRGNYAEFNVVPPSYQPSYPAVPPVSGTENPVEGTDSRSSGLDPVEIVRNSGDVPGLQSTPEGTVLDTGDFHINGRGETVINVKKPSAAAVPDTPPVGKAVAPAPVSVEPVPAAPNAKTVPRTASAVLPVPLVASVPKPAIQTKAHDDYWVQTGAFSTIVKAEGVKESLSLRGITSIIENREVDGRILFRVRVGPYTSQNEAGYWLSLIKSIEGFENSQIRMTQAQR